MGTPKFRKPTGLTMQVLRSPELGIDTRMDTMVFGVEKVWNFDPIITNPG
jgi:hypothetical protein